MSNTIHTGVFGMKEPDRKFGRFRSRRLRLIRTQGIQLFKRDAVPELMLKEWRFLRYKELTKYYQEQ
jgi:hypothetical protein